MLKNWFFDSWVSDVVLILGDILLFLIVLIVGLLLVPFMGRATDDGQEVKISVYPGGHSGCGDYWSFDR
ncbi:MAG: hypothetical protein PHS27_01305 [Candidatus Pacebacteria bacterium]|nr:hypothetical protein [Candidatus Paceibacterota bacterium]